MKKYSFLIFMICLLFCLAGCRTENNLQSENSSPSEVSENSSAGGENTVQTNKAYDKPYTADTKISDVINDPVFGSYGRLIFPVDSGYYGGDTLGSLRLT